jgi:hypothetical protein
VGGSGLSPGSVDAPGSGPPGAVAAGGNAAITSGASPLDPSDDAATGWGDVAAGGNAAITAGAGGDSLADNAASISAWTSLGQTPG